MFVIARKVQGITPNEIEHYLPRSDVYQIIMHIWFSKKVTGSGILSNDLDQKILILNITTIVLMGIFLWYKIFLPYAYFIGLFFLGLFLAISSLSSRTESNLSVFKFLQIFTLYFFILSVFSISTKYTVIPLGDDYIDYAITRRFLNSGHISIIQPTPGPYFISDLFEQISFSSGWPLTHTIVIIFSTLTSLTLFQTTFILSLSFSLLAFVFVYIFIEKTKVALNLTSLGVILALLLYLSWPNGIFWSLHFGHMNMGKLFFTMMVYLSLKYESKPFDRRNIILITLIGASLVFSHHFSSLVMVGYLFLLSFIVFVGNYLFRTTNSLSKSLRPMWNFAILIFAILILWWDNVASAIWPVLGSFIQRFIQILLRARTYEPIVNIASYPDSLTPNWVILLNVLRTILILVPALLGGLTIFRGRPHVSQRPFLISSGIAFGILWILGFQSVSFEWNRIITLAMPFVCVYGAFFIDKRINKLKLSNIIISLFIILLVASSFTGLWGIAHAPVHLYDSTINAASVGEHNTNFMTSGKFLDAFIDLQRFNNISADDPLLLYVILPPNEYEKVRYLDDSDIYHLSASARVIIEFNGLNLYKYYYFLEPKIEPEDIEPIKSQLKEALETHLNRVYDNGNSAIWMSRTPALLP